MGRKSKARSKSGKANSAKKMKVSDGSKNENVETMEVEEDVEEEQWEGVRVIVQQEQIQCRSDGCANIATATWVSKQSGDKWNMCKTCQLADFGECYEESCPDPSMKASGEPAQTSSNSCDAEADHKTTTVDSDPSAQMSAPKDGEKNELVTPCPGTKDLPQEGTLDPPQEGTLDLPQEGTLPKDDTDAHESSTMPESSVITQSSVSEDDEGGEAENQGGYDLVKIFSIEDLLKDDAICCSQDRCGGLPAFGLYANNADPHDRWFYCLDCQMADFDGWPPLEELPLSYMDAAHLRVIADKCSRQRNPDMPVFPASLSPMAKSTLTHPAAHIVTPLADSPDTKSLLVAPNPMVESTANANSTAGKTKNKTVLNVRALEAHKKWLEAAQAIGGKDARIIVSKPSAKKLIFDFLHDAFCPMNITQIYKGLKAVVPQPVLNACLQEMVPDTFSGKPSFQDSDDEDDGTTKYKENTSTEPYAASLVFKAGKNLSTNLYYVDYNQVRGLDREEREMLSQEIAKANSEEQMLLSVLRDTKDLSKKLLVEPRNEELGLALEADESSVQDLEEKLNEAQKLKVNEKHRQATKLRIQKMAAHWRQRKRLCENFLSALEENTDGIVSRTKCLKGDGPIALDSDEIVAEAAVKYSKDKRSRNSRKGFQGNKKSIGIRAGVNGGKAVAKREGLALESDLVAVVLDKQLNVERVYANVD